MKKSVFVCAASSGIGKQIALDLANKGYFVFAGVRTKSAKKLLESLSQNILGVYIDVTSESSVLKAKKFISSKTDKLDAFINCAGTALCFPLELINTNEIRKQFEVNAFAPVFLAKTFLPFFQNSKFINISSMAQSGIFPFISTYCASKKAGSILLNLFAIELSSKNVKFIQINPGVVKTPIWEKSAKKTQELLEACKDPCKLNKYLKTLCFLEHNALNNSKKGLSVIDISNFVAKVLNKKNPKPFYNIGFDAIVTDIFAKLPFCILNFLVKFYLDYRVCKFSKAEKK